MKREWNSMANSNAAFYVLTAEEFEDADDIDYESFFDSGKSDVDDILEALHVSPNSNWSALDIGCGLGRLTRRLDSHFGETIGIDVSKVMVERAAALTPSIQFLEASGTDLQLFPDGRFDIVFSFIVFQHLPHPRLALGYISEMARVLKPGGLGVFQIPTSFYPRLKRRYWRWLQKRAAHYREDVAPRSLVLDAGQPQRFGTKHDLRTEVVLFEGTMQTYYRMRKHDPNASPDVRRHADERRRELAKLLG